MKAHETDYLKSYVIGDQQIKRFTHFPVYEPFTLNKGHNFK